jgi:hypothetical protein
VTAKVAGTGKRVTIGLVLGSPQGSAAGGLALGRGITVSGRGTRRVVVVGRVPATVARGELRTLLVCIDPAGAIRGKARCRTAARIATSGTSIEERVAGARLAGRLSKAKAILFGVLALRGDQRVPAELRGDIGGPGGEEAAVLDLRRRGSRHEPRVRRDRLHGSHREGGRRPAVHRRRPRRPVHVDHARDEVLKSDDPRLLEGHRVRQDPTMTFTIDDTWSFKGSE